MPAPVQAQDGPDVLRYYDELIKKDPLVTPSIAAIESLISLLSTRPTSTISETLSLLIDASEQLKSHVSNPLPIKASTDLFQRYIINAFQTRALDLSESDGKDLDDFEQIRQYLLANSRAFAQRARDARDMIARRAARLIHDDTTVITFGSSRAVRTTLEETATGNKQFRVIYVDPSPRPGSRQGIPLTPASEPWIKQLQSRGVPVAVIPFDNLASAMPTASFALLGAEAVVENGGVVSQMGTHQLAQVAKHVGVPVYVAAETHKFTRTFPIDESDIWTKGQGGVKFSVGDGMDSQAEELVGGMDAQDAVQEVDYTPPHLIKALVTETSTQSPNAVSEELIMMFEG